MIYFYANSIFFSFISECFYERHFFLLVAEKHKIIIEVVGGAVSGKNPIELSPTWHWCGSALKKRKAEKRFAMRKFCNQSAMKVRLNFSSSIRWTFCISYDLCWFLSCDITTIFLFLIVPSAGNEAQGFNFPPSFNDKTNFNWNRLMICKIILIIYVAIHYWSCELCFNYKIYICFGKLIIRKLM